MKKLFYIIITACFLLCSCQKAPVSTGDDDSIITDSLGNSAHIPSNARIVSCYGSFSECWLLSGGILAGVTEDALTERGLDTSAVSVGTVKDINSELLISLSPDYVILSSEIASHSRLAEALETAGISCGFFKIDTFSDYADLMRQFCSINHRDDLYKKNVEDVSEKINALLSSIPEESDKTYLVMRAYSNGIKVKTDNIADNILKEFNLKSIVDNDPSVLKDLSAEHILKQDPDYIFVITMGDEEAAYNYLSEMTKNNPAWNELKAVKNNNYIILPKELFHYKPNNRWNESYEYIAKIIYPQIFS